MLQSEGKQLIGQIVLPQSHTDGDGIGTIDGGKKLLFVVCGRVIEGQQGFREL